VNPDQDSPISATRMAELLAAGEAIPLLADHFPVPAVWDNRWWHIPADGPAHHYQPAPPAQAQVFARLARRRQVAAAGIAQADTA
jgi:hypothetical protein